MSDMGCDSFERGERLAAKAERAKIANEGKDKRIQWVISKYAKEGEGEKFEVIEDYPASYLIKVIQNDRWYNLDAPKIEYLPTTPPERWETVPIGERLQVFGRGSVHMASIPDNERLIIQDGKLVLQRKAL